MDIRTLALVNLILLFLYALIIATNTGIHGKIRGSTWFVWSNLSRGTAWLLLLFSKAHSTTWATIVGDGLLLLGLLLLHRSLAEVLERGKTAWRLQLIIAASGVGCVCYSTLVYGSYNAALLFASLCVGVQLALTIALLFSGLRRGFRAAVWFTGSTLFFCALAEITRAISLTHPTPDALQIHTSTTAILLLGALLANASTTFGFLFLSAAQLRLELTVQAEHDALTGLLNRRGLKRIAECTLRANHLSGEPLAAVMLDLDGMKHANDTWGHETGDALLCAVAKVLTSIVGQRGAVARLGGDEFLVVLPGMAEGGAYEMAETLRRAIERLRVANCRPRASFGVACLKGFEWEDAVRLSDQALNRAKSSGRNRVICYA